MTNKPHMTLPDGDKLYEGDYGRTRDWQRQGPAVYNKKAEDWSKWSLGDKGYYSDGRWSVCSPNDPSDIIAKWTDAPAEPVLWRDMTPEQKGALLLAHQEGKVIEVKEVHQSNWSRNDYPEWWREFAYRVRPEPKRETRPLYYGGQFVPIVQIGTIDLIDGKPDPASIRIEAIE
jgi:hypothetical protein